MIKNWVTARAKAIAETIKKEKAFYLFLLLCMIIPATFVIIMHTRTLPYAEGWYTYYAKCINEGILPYRDFEYLYPPLYIYTVAFITRIFGYDLIVLRRLGILFFALISLGVYLAITEIVGKKQSWIALVASVTAVFYLQSEVVQTFYDYVRLMDVFAAFSLLFVIRSVKGIINGTLRRRDLAYCGLLCALFVFTKQNIGLIFFVYSIVLLLYTDLWCRRSFKDILKDFGYLFVPVAAVAAVIFGFFLITGSFSGFLSMTGLSAASAKGGINSIFFGWIINNRHAFISSLSFSLPMLGALVALYLWRRLHPPKESKLDKMYLGGEFWISLGFSVLMFLGLLIMKFSKGFALWLLPSSFLNPYAVFVVVFPIFLACGIWGIIDTVRHTDTMRDVYLLFALAGAYFAISFGCGNSGGLAEGQATFGVAFIVTALLLYLDRSYCRLVRVAIVCGCLVLSLQNADKKMVNTYNWWGMSEPDYWSCTEKTDLPLLRGLRLSPETKAVYESIYTGITENTAPTDPIISFPQIPIFYNLCDRPDPGIFSKVQWFDVATDDSVLGDIDTLRKNPPKAVLIYNSSDYAYTSHENAFRGGNISGTQLMRTHLWELVYQNGYRYMGTFCSHGNTLSLWVYDQTGETKGVWFDGGTGTVEDPYLISTPDQFRMFGELVSAGKSFENLHIKQTCDIDMSGYGMPPIGRIEGELYFKGFYNGGGHVIRNLTIKGKDNLGLFVALQGTVYNLGLEDCSFSGTCCGGISFGSSGPNASIINCYTDVDISAYRAGGIADDFGGAIENCFSLGNLQGIDDAHAITQNRASSIVNVFVSEETLSIEDSETQSFKIIKGVSFVKKSKLNSADILDDMNAYVARWNETTETNLVLIPWKTGPNGHFIFAN